ncbi:hypothetical protein GJ744_012103 [Endocarpon pusillum]|uniref:Myb-like DNA-binding domain-containing protein n=1 Tax=Endocarpon pusillum TaxID=364733 RepID=A0A8H7AFM0_9EURO|nr:hypothetical protein GJ744_012103 [Endocarpon pusillum]
MPSRTHPDEKLLLLFHCLKASDYTTIDFHAVAAALGTTVAAARMRLNRLRAEIETRASNPEATTLPTSGRTETTTGWVHKTTTKKRAIEQHRHLPGTTAGGDQNARGGEGSSIKNQTAVPEIRTPGKRQTHGKTIDVSAAFSSDPSTALEPHIPHEGDVKNYEEGRAAATDRGEWRWSDSESEHEHPAKRCRSSPPKQKPNAQGIQTFAASSHSAATSTQDVFIVASEAEDAIIPPPLAIVTPSTTANRTNPWSLTPGRADSISDLLPPSPISIPTSSDSLSSTDANYGDSDNDMSIEDVIDPTTEMAPRIKDNSEMYGNNGPINEKQHSVGCIIQEAEEQRPNSQASQSSWLPLWFGLVRKERIGDHARR